VEAEIIAIKGAVELCKVLGFDIIGTPAVEREIGMIKDDMKRQDVRDFYDWAISDFVGFNDVIYARAQEIRGMANIKNRDSLPHRTCRSGRSGLSFDGRSPSHKRVF
jgi:hypothetical protein